MPPLSFRSPLAGWLQAADAASNASKPERAVLAVAAGLASVLRTLAPEHWIVNLMAVRLARMLRETGLERSHPLDLIAAEYLQLSCAAAALNPQDYTLSNCNERLVACWSGYATMLGEEGHKVGTKVSHRPRLTPPPPASHSTLLLRSPLFKGTAT